jgi:hypothetical protein
MKSLVIGFICGLMLVFAAPTFAGPHDHHRWNHHRHHIERHHHWHHRNNWVVPAIIGGAVVYAATRPTPVIVQQPTVVLQPNQIIIDGVVYNKQIMIINGVETEVLVRL